MRVEIPGKEARSAVRVALGPDSVSQRESRYPLDLPRFTAVGLLLKVMACRVEGIVVATGRKLDLGLRMQYWKLIQDPRRGNAQTPARRLLPAFSSITVCELVVDLGGWIALVSD